jgi:hypothetical protein
MGSGGEDPWQLAAASSVRSHGHSMLVPDTSCGGEFEADSASPLAQLLNGSVA